MISRISRNAVKEGFDTLPAAICYFDRNGLLRLINHRMQEIAAVLCGCEMRPPASTHSRTERYIISRCALFRTNTAYRTPR